MIRRLFIKMVPITFLSSLLGWRFAKGVEGGNETLNTHSPEWLPFVFWMLDRQENGTNQRHRMIQYAKELVSKHLKSFGDDWPTVAIAVSGDFIQYIKISNVRITIRITQDSVLTCKYSRVYNELHDYCRSDS